MNYNELATAISNMDPIKRLLDVMVIPEHSTHDILPSYVMRIEYPTRFYSCPILILKDNLVDDTKNWKPLPPGNPED